MVNLQIDDNDNLLFDGNDRESHDHDSYESYAGASYRNSTNGHCVKYGGTVSGQGYFKSYGSEWRNCG